MQKFAAIFMWLFKTRCFQFDKMRTYHYQHRLIAVVVIIFAGLFILLLDRQALEMRRVPSRSKIKIVRVSSQAQVFPVLKKMGVYGATILHLNRHMNMVEYYPLDEKVSEPFPIRTKDMRHEYEKGVAPHTWLFLANRVGLIRNAIVVLPHRLFPARRDALLSEPGFFLAANKVFGYVRDFRVDVTTIDSLPYMHEPVVIDIDAGYFSSEADSAKIADLLVNACPDIRLLVLVESSDDIEVTGEMRIALEQFLTSIRERLK